MSRTARAGSPVVELTPEWKNYALLPDRFAQWEAKAVKKNAFTPAAAAKLSFGLAANFNPRVAKGDHTFWVDRIGMASNRLGPIDLSRKVDLNIFYDYEPYRLTQCRGGRHGAGEQGHSGRAAHPRLLRRIGRSRFRFPQRIEVHPPPLHARPIRPRPRLGRRHARQLWRDLSRLVVDLLRHHESGVLCRARRARHHHGRDESRAGRPCGSGAGRECPGETGRTQTRQPGAQGLHPPQPGWEAPDLSGRPAFFHERLQLRRRLRSLRRPNVEGRLLQRRCRARRISARRTRRASTACVIGFPASTGTSWAAIFASRT